MSNTVTMILNQLKTFALLSSLSALLASIGYLFGGLGGLLFALIIATLINAVTYFYSDRLILSLYRAQELDGDQYPFVYDIVADLVTEMRLPMPRLYYIPTALPNAFATGRSPRYAAIAVTSGILTLLEKHELRGVLAHELAHIKNRDILVGTIAATMATAIGYLADTIRWSLFWGHRGRNNRNHSSASLLLIALVTPFAALLIQLAISRSREYLADECGAHACQDPLALASALEKLHIEIHQAHTEAPSSAHATAASLFIMYPFVGHNLLNLFSTHPPLEQRIERLHRLAGRR